MAFSKIKSWAKINLSLNVIKRLSNHHHKIESLITFIKVFDEISIKISKKNNHNIYFYGKFSKGIGKKNTVSDLLYLLEKKNLIKHQKFDIKIKKNIPQKAGMGGGSMNAANILKYLVLRKIINISNKEAYQISNKIGSDVAIGLQKKNSILFKDKSIARSNIKLNLYVLVVKPKINCSTKEIYKNVENYSKSIYLGNKKGLFKISNLIKSSNDLEIIVFKIHPIIKKLKIFLSKLPKVTFVRMTGSGSTIVAYFKSKKSLINATKIFKRKYKNYWYIKSKTI